MNENPQSKRLPGDGPSIATGLVIGALVGAGIALLLAPATGKETRRRLADAGRRWGGVARDKLDEARALADDLKQDARSALDAGRERYEWDRRSHEPQAAAPAEQKT